jgi:hypothetical protein
VANVPRISLRVSLAYATDDDSELARYPRIEERELEAGYTN